jgi:hypothetical protein
MGDEDAKRASCPSSHIREIAGIKQHLQFSFDVKSSRPDAQIIPVKRISLDDDYSHGVSHLPLRRGNGVP